MPEDGVSEVKIQSWAQLMDEVYAGSWDPQLARHRSPFVFRGAGACDQALTTSLMRLAAGREPVARIEGHLIRNFRKYARSGIRGDTIWNWLALAAHHSLPTRLLDWSFSPLVALHFATADVSLYDRDAVVWCVNHRQTNLRLPRRLREQLEIEGSDVFTVQMLERVVHSLEALASLAEEEFILFLEPPSLDARIVNQFALFSLMSEPGLALDRWLASHPGSARTLVLPSSLKWEVRDKLDQAGITERMLFPGLDGLTAWLTRYYAPRTQPIPPQEGNALRENPSATHPACA
jgi:hypothetical protein